MENASENFKKIAIIHPNTQGSIKIANELNKYFTPTKPEQSDLIIVSEMYCPDTQNFCLTPYFFLLVY